MPKVIPFLWFEKDAEAAAKFYTVLLPDSHVDSVTDLPVETPSGPAGSVQVVEFTLAGQPYQAMNAAGRPDAFNHAVSFMIECETQDEIDRIWEAHLKNGGKAVQCGWLQDTWGLYWQVVPANIGELTRNTNREGARRAAEAMMQMIKLDKAALERAFAGS
jgi:predicted 3-demethylubiquinone-9 3-methyltransferase (glyoxalase superfamily)